MTLLLAALSAVPLSGCGRREPSAEATERAPDPHKPRIGCRPPSEISPEDGSATIADVDDYLSMTVPFAPRSAPRGVMLWTRTFVIDEVGGSEPWVYFVNFRRHQAHWSFLPAIGCEDNYRTGRSVGTLFYHPSEPGPDGEAGTFLFDVPILEEPYDYEVVAGIYRHLIRAAPLLEGDLSFLPLASRQQERVTQQLERYREGGLPIGDLTGLQATDGYLALNVGETFGRLRALSLGELPLAHDIAIYSALPNDLPPVAGVISTVQQTPLSHVNLRAIQYGTPNAYVDGALERPEIAALLGGYVFYKVGATGFELREATEEETQLHLARLRPAAPQTPVRDLSVRDIAPLDTIGFAQAPAFGAKASNVAQLRRLGFPEGSVPDGWAVPFYFYDAFMRHNRLYEALDTMRAAPAFTADRDARSTALRAFRERVRAGVMPPLLATALAAVQASVPAGTALRCRSSTNNEDLPDYSGAGLYNSYTHHPEEGHLSETIKQVFASMWTLRAFEDREFHRIDHSASAMGVLIHPNYQDERVNGVAVSGEVLYNLVGWYYVNSQVGEDLVTNPEAESIPEELALRSTGSRPPSDMRVLRYSNQVPSDTPLLSTEQAFTLRDRLRAIHQHFAELYGRTRDPNFMMEIEFKITADGVVVIKQARPWVSAARRAATPPEAAPAP